MNCDELKNLLHGYLDGELDLVRNLQIERHLDTCPACAGALAQLKKLRRVLQEPALYHRPGPGLRQRILSSLPQAQASAAPARRQLRRSPALALSLAVAASVAFLALSIWGVAYLRSNGGEDFTMRVVVAGHVRSLLLGGLVGVASSDQHTVKPWFAKSGKLDFAPPVANPDPAGYPLIGGRVDYLDNQKVAALVYQRQQHVINLFIWPATSGEDEALRKSTRQGYHVLHWARGGFHFWAVSDLNAEELQKFAELIRR